MSVAQQAVPFDGPVFFGGVPDEYNIAAAASATDTNFFGCIGDVTLNSKIVNFAESTDRPRALLQKCPLVRSSSHFQSSTFGMCVVSVVSACLMVHYFSNYYFFTCVKPHFKNSFIESYVFCVFISQVDLIELSPIDMIAYQHLT